MIQKQTLTSQVFDHLMEQIRNGTTQPGDRLPTEKELVARLGVSRTCVREAVKALEALRLVTVRPKIGAVLQQPSGAALFNAELFSAAAHSEKKDVLMEFRKIVETGLVSLAAEKANSGDLSAIAKTIEQYEQALKEHKPPYQADVDFHVAVAIASKNLLGRMVLENIAKPLAQQLQLANSVQNAPEEGLRDHLKIFGAISERNPGKARAAMRQHMENAERYWRIANSGLTSQEVLDGIGEILDPSKL
jgi:GntR family transcriptional repressor for pyruvate dehydrogenase complex